MAAIEGQIHASIERGWLLPPCFDDVRNSCFGNAHLSKAVLFEDVIACGETEALEFAGCRFYAVYFSGGKFPISRFIPIRTAIDRMIGEPGLFDAPSPVGAWLGGMTTHYSPPPSPPPPSPPPSPLPAWPNPPRATPSSPETTFAPASGSALPPTTVSPSADNRW